MRQRRDEADLLGGFLNPDIARRAAGAFGQRRQGEAGFQAAAQVAVLVLEGAPEDGLPEGSENRLLMGVGARAIAARVGGARRLLSLDSMPPAAVSRTVDLRSLGWFGAIGEAMETLILPAQMPIRVIGEAVGGADFVEIVIDEAPLRRAMLKFSVNLLLISLVISGLTAVAVYVALGILWILPFKRVFSGVGRGE